ncbi:MAG: homocysteine S-methyltransferase family protein [Pseudomonadota bacterium]
MTGLDRGAPCLSDSSVLLLDGGIGLELRRRMPDADTALLPADALVAAPHVVRQVHADYIRSGAQVITTNTYATGPDRLAALTEHAARWAELVERACRLAAEAREASEKTVAIAGCLPPLHGSYRPENVRPHAEIAPVYRAFVEIMAPHVDLFLCETMSSAAEGFAAAEAATASGKPVWVSWTVRDDRSGILRSGETIRDAFAALKGLPVQAVMANCAAPESLTAAMPYLAACGTVRVGGHANGFVEVPEKWSVRDGISALGRREDLDPSAYAGHAEDWLAAGASIIGGCCGVGPEHIACLDERLREVSVKAAS